MFTRVFTITIGILLGVSAVIGMRQFTTARLDPKTAVLPPESQSEEVRVSNPAMPDIPAASAENVRPDGSKAVLPQPVFSADTAAAPVQPEGGDCDGAADGFRCFVGFYRTLTRNRGVQAALADMKSRYNAGDAFIRSQCHQLIHVIGRTAMDIYPTVSAAYKNGDPFCWSGYYHGVMEGIVGAIGRTKLPSRLNGICADIPGKGSYSFDYYNCVHGLGHGIMAIENNELFKSLETCDYLAGSWEQSSCHGGAFMENIIADEINHVSKYLKADDPLYPCDAVGEKYKGACYLMQTSRMLAVLGQDFARVFEWCRKADEGYRATCFQSLGRDASGRTISDVERTKALCLLGRDVDEQSHCIVGAVKDFISYHHSDTEARALCAAVPDNLRSVCLSTAESYYTFF